MAKRLDQLHEADIARRLGGRIQPGSGNQWKAKGDVKTPAELVSCKDTERKSFGLSRQIWQEIREQAAMEGLEPVVAIRFEPNHPGQGQTDLIVIDLAHYEELRQDAEQRR